MTPFVQQSMKNPQVQPEKIRTDCCDLCLRVDGDDKEMEACKDMTKRCKGDTCATCKACKQFVKNQKRKPVNVGWL